MADSYLIIKNKKTRKNEKKDSQLSSRQGRFDN
jgi:hypothetical protein